MLLTPFILLLERLKELISRLHGNDATCDSVQIATRGVSAHICASCEMFSAPVCPSYANCCDNLVNHSVDVAVLYA